MLEWSYLQQYNLPTMPPTGQKTREKCVQIGVEFDGLLNPFLVGAVQLKKSGVSGLQ